MTRKTEAVTPPATVKKLLDAGGEDLVLVGGQALAFWVDRYGLSQSNQDMPAISSDVDFLSRSAADREIVDKLAKVIKGRAIYPNQRALTALVGQAVPRPVACQRDANDRDPLRQEIRGRSERDRRALGRQRVRQPG